MYGNSNRDLSGTLSSGSKPKTVTVKDKDGDGGKGSSSETWEQTNVLRDNSEAKGTMPLPYEQ